MGATDISQFLTWLAFERHVSASAQNQALSALLFLYKHVLGTDLCRLDQVPRARMPIRVPVVLSRDTYSKTGTIPSRFVRVARTPKGYIFYQGAGEKRWVCAVAQHATDRGFLITAYPTDAIKEGIQIWPK